MKQIPDKLYECFINRIKPLLPILHREKKVVVSVSGGPDSMFLLFLFTKFSLKHKIEIKPIYINHKVRTKTEIKKDIQTIKTFCKQNNLSLTVTEINPKKHDENTLRELRYKKLVSLAKKFNCSIIATAHTLNDVVETFFLNLLRGSGLKGLCSIPVIREEKVNGKTFYIIRPIIDISKQQILEILNQQKIPFVIDKTNLDVVYKRNFLRNKIFPLLKQINPSFENNVLSVTTLINQLYEYITENIDGKIKWLSTKKASVDLQEFLMYNIFIKREILYRIISLLAAKHRLNLRQGYKNVVDKILQFICGQTCRVLSITKKLAVRKNKKHLIIYLK